METLNEEYYLDIIHEKEKNGQCFLDLMKDIGQLELNLFDTGLKYTHFIDFKKYRDKYGIKKGILILLGLFFIRGLSRRFIWKGSFFVGFFYPVLICLAVSAIVLPIYLIGRKFPKFGFMLASIMLVLGIAFLALLFLLLVILIANSIFHFWF